MDLVVKEAPPAVKGDTRQGGSKQIVLETGAVINAPLFVNEGDLIRVNTELRSYVERVDKK
jgi:elongation factor P